MGRNDRRFVATLSDKKGKSIEVSTQVVSFNQNDISILFAPALEVYGYGKDIEEAEQSFKFNIEQFFNYTTNKGTLQAELKSLGWSYKKRQQKYEVPAFTKLLKRSNNLTDILNSNNATILQKPISVPV